ncbi:MAG: hypothetical protein AAF986_08330 [Pseudomonadota bacterium]
MRDDFTTLTALMNKKARGDDVDRYNHAVSGVEVGDGSAHYSQQEASEAAATTTQNGRKQDRKASDALWRDIINQQIAELQNLISGHEGRFAAEYGEAWREDLALQILDPDLIPQRREGESMEAYRERLEQALMDELLNEDGTIKDKYKDHPEYGEYAQWAQWKYDQQQAQAFKAGMNDPLLSEAERAALLGEYMQSATHERLKQLIDTTDPDSQSATQLEAAKDRIENTMADTTSKIGDRGFLN